MTLVGDNEGILLRLIPYCSIWSVDILDEIAIS